MKNYSTLLKVVSIILIIFNSLALITDVLSLIALNSPALIELQDSVTPTSTYITITMELVFAVITLVLAIVGVVNYATPERWKLLLGAGIAIFIMTLISKLSSFFITSTTNVTNNPLFSTVALSALTIIGIVIALILPSLYIVGAFSLKKIQARYENEFPQDNDSTY